MTDHPTQRRFVRFATTFACASVVAALGTVMGPAAAASVPATVIDGCSIVADPTPANHTDCSGASMNGANLNGLNLTYADFTRAHLNGAHLRAAILEHAVLKRTGLHNADMRSADLTGANLNNAIMAGVDLTNAAAVIPTHGARPVTFRDTDLDGANILGLNAPRADLRGATFVGASLISVDLHAANLSGDNLTGIKVGGNFVRANVTGVSFQGTLLAADFTRTILVPASQTVTATGSNGAVVTWPAPQSLPGATSGSCRTGKPENRGHPVTSGDVFPMGTTTVTCTVSSGSWGEFWVHVLPAA
jgi:uncharacterized protein YjbI with pentapeptide repeats